MSQVSQDDLDLRTFAEPHWFRIVVYHEEFSTRLTAQKIPVLKHTPKGAWLRVNGDKRFVLRDYTHRARAFAAPTRDLAKEDFRKRKLFHIRMLKIRLDTAQQELDLLDGFIL